jgi:hypothetical protein
MPADIEHFAIARLPAGGVTGTVSITAASRSVIGVGTNFQTLGLKAGATILVAGEEHTLRDDPINDTNITTVNVWGQTAAGQAYVAYAMLDLNFSGIPFPQGLYNPYSQLLDLGDGSIRGGGWATAEWHWGYLTRGQRQSLAGYLPVNAPSRGNPGVFVRLRTAVNENNDAFVTFKGQALWPYPEKKDFQRRPDFVLKFRALVDLS